MTTISRPAADEYAPAFAGYVAHIRNDENIVDALAAQLDEVRARLGAVPESRGEYRYAPGKWTLKEVVGHLADTERVFAYRALRIARGDTIPLPAFDDQAWVAEMGAAGRTLADMVEEFATVRQATLALFRHLPPAAWSRRGIASDHPASVRALAYVVAGHARHHLEVVEARYLG
ncbi:MAG: DinB family protein [Gemmatimonadales bacterium]